MAPAAECHRLAQAIHVTHTHTWRVGSRVSAHACCPTVACPCIAAMLARRLARAVVDAQRRTIHSGLPVLQVRPPGGLRACSYAPPAVP